MLLLLLLFILQLLLLRVLLLVSSLLLVQYHNAHITALLFLDVVAAIGRLLPQVSVRTGPQFTPLVRLFIIRFANTSTSFQGILLSLHLFSYFALNVGLGVLVSDATSIVVGVVVVVCLATRTLYQLLLLNLITLRLLEISVVSFHFVSSGERVLVKGRACPIGVGLSLGGEGRLVLEGVGDSSEGSLELRMYDFADLC